MLHRDGALRGELDAIAVDGRTKHHALGVDLAHLAQAEHLVAAGIGEDRPRPVHEPVQAAQVADRLGAGPQHEVEGVAEQHLRAGLGQQARRHALDCSVGAARHERRRLHAAVARREPAAARRAVVPEHLKHRRRDRRTWRRRS